jgi:hypothetical protein
MGAGLKAASCECYDVIREHIDKATPPLSGSDLASLRAKRSNLDQLHEIASALTRLGVGFAPLHDCTHTITPACDCAVAARAAGRAAAIRPTAGMKPAPTGNSRGQTRPRKLQL